MFSHKALVASWKIKAFALMIMNDIHTFYHLMMLNKFYDKPLTPIPLSVHVVQCFYTLPLLFLSPDTEKDRFSSLQFFSIKYHVIET